MILPGWLTDFGAEGLADKKYSNKGDRMKDLEERLKSAEDLIREARVKGIQWKEWGGMVDSHFEKYEPKDTLREIWGCIYENIDSSCGENEAIWNSEFKQILPLITEAKRQGAIEVLEEIGCGQAVMLYDGKEDNSVAGKAFYKLKELKENK